MKFPWKAARTLIVGRLDRIARQNVRTDIGFGMALSQEANKALRHCRIGMVREKPDRTLGGVSV